MDSLFRRLEDAGETIEAWASWLGSSHSSLLHGSEFFRHITRFSPNRDIQGSCPRVLRRLSAGSGRVSAVLADAAMAAQGMSALGRVLATGIRFVRQACGLGVGPEEGPQPIKIVLSSLNQLPDVLRSIEAGEDVELDVSADMTIAEAMAIYQEIAATSPNALQIMSRGPHMASKLAQEARVREMRARQPTQGLAVVLPQN